LIIQFQGFIIIDANLSFLKNLLSQQVIFFFCPYLRIRILLKTRICKEIIVNFSLIIFYPLDTITKQEFEMGLHHLILGQVKDFLTGETIKDTHDERYRQKIARLLVETKGFSKTNITPRFKLTVKTDDKTAEFTVDYLIKLQEKVCMIIKYSPGSLTTRHRSALALSRLAVPYQIPIVVVSNGEESEVLDGSTGKVASQGFESIPDKSQLLKIAADAPFDKISEKRAAMEAKIVYACEIDGSCSCDENIC
jgi:hypothetical protein